MPFSRAIVYPFFCILEMDIIFHSRATSFLLLTIQLHITVPSLQAEYDKQLTLRNTYGVGYMSGADTVQQNNFIAAPFSTIGCNTIDIQDIQITNGDVGWETEYFSIWAGAPEVVEGTSFVYLDPSYDMSGESKKPFWGDSGYNKANFSIAEGQSFVIECNEGLKVQTAGGVPKDPVEFTTAQQNNFVANPFPASIDIQDVEIGGGDVGWETEYFSIWAGAPEVVEGTSFVYLDPSYDMSGESKKPFWGDSGYNKVSYSIPAGQGFVIECNEGLTITINPPYSL